MNVVMMISVDELYGNVWDAQKGAKEFF